MRWRWGLILGTSLLVLMLGWGVRSWLAPQVAVVQMDEALAAHPRWGELRLLQEELALRQRLTQERTSGQEKLQNQREKVETTIHTFSLRSLEQLQDEEVLTTEELQTALQKAMVTREIEVWNRVKEKVDAEKARVENDLEQDLSLKRGQLAQERESFARELQRKYGVRILNLQVKLAALTLSEAEKKAIEEEIQRLKREADDQMARKEEALQQEYQRYLAQKQQEAESRLRQYALTLNQQAEEELKAEQRRLETKMKAEIENQRRQIQRAIRQVEEAMSFGVILPPEGSAREEKQELLPLQERILALEALIRQDVEAAAVKVARARNLRLVLVQGVAPGRAVNITQAVVEILKSY